MIPLTPSFLVAAAAPLVGLREEGDNQGGTAETFLREVAQPAGQAWSTAFVQHVGYWAHYEIACDRSSWPLPAGASCQNLGAFARAHGILQCEPQAGDVFLVFSPLHARFAHAGVVVRVCDAGGLTGPQPWFDCNTIEGNTNDGAGRERRGVLRKVRRFHPEAGDRFVRWTDLRARPTASRTTTTPTLA